MRATGFANQALPITALARIVEKIISRDCPIAGERLPDTRTAIFAHD
jgi:hypothetical protein